MERKIRLMTLRVWPEGITDEELASQLEHVAEMLRQGCFSGEVCPEHGRGWWDTFETDDESAVAAS